MRRPIGVLAAALAVCAAAASPAAAHVQVRPAQAAPGDPVLFEVLVPNEQDARTTEIALQIPKDVLPFSWQDTPGWKRTTETADDGSIAVVRWKGRLAPDGFARFSFLASTPEQDGEVIWKAIQTYENGDVVRWIGGPDSDEPAAVTRVSKDVPRQNAGGEGASAEDGAARPSASPAATSAAAPAASGEGEGEGEGEGDATLPTILAAAALVIAVAALVVALSGRRRATVA